MAAEGAFVKPLFSYNFNSLRYINGKIYELPLKDILLSSFLCLAYVFSFESMLQKCSLARLVISLFFNKYFYCYSITVVCLFSPFLHTPS